VPLVLVVDDSITVRRVTQRLLQREGYRVTLAADGLQAMERLQDERPTLVLSDIEMPRMDALRSGQTCADQTVGRHAGAHDHVQTHCRKKIAKATLSSAAILHLQPCRAQERLGRSQQDLWRSGLKRLPELRQLGVGVSSPFTVCPCAHACDGGLRRALHFRLILI
jgi:response regulator RpfG family c-di-GMP phosphodiesterase